MARSGSSARGSAHGTPSSLTSLLAPTQPTRPSDFTSTISMLRAMADQTAHQLELRTISDRREYHPQKKLRPPGAMIRSAARLYHAKPNIRSPLSFKVPNLITLCIRRKIRKEVLHALNRTRKGSRGGHRRRNIWSNIKC